jgi:glyoxylase-like metal-dependent hydrolase (beta-lactamase superfamily II)
MILEALSLGPLETNCYILALEKNSAALIIDPGSEPRKIKAVLEHHGLRPAAVINTHGHYDHIGCDDKFDVPVYVHKDELVMLRNADKNLSAVFSLGYSVKAEIRVVEEGSVINEAGIRLKVIHLPGHTPGGMALLLEEPAEKMVFTGDALFYRSIGRSDLEGGDGELLARCIKEKLLSLDPETLVYPGHGPSSTIGYEKAHNEYIK